MNRLKGSRLTSVMLVFLLIALMVAPAIAASPLTVNMGTIPTFAVLAGTTITNTGSSTITGSTGPIIGLAPGSSFVGGPPLMSLSGTIHINDTVAIAAKAALIGVYNDAAGRTPTLIIASELGGQTLTPGVYTSANGTFQITGILTLDGANDPNAVFIFQTAATLTTITGSEVKLINGAHADRVFWQVGTSATLGTTSQFQGTILALDSITATTGAVIRGRLLARNGAVTLDNNTFINGGDNAVLRVIKNVINDNGGIAIAADFNLHVKTDLGIPVDGSPAVGLASPGRSYALAAGDYVVSEDSYPGYTLTFSGDSDANGNITLAAGDVKTVTLTNNDNSAVVVPPGQATLHVIKNVINNDGGTAGRGDFTLHVKTTAGIAVAGSPAPGTASPGTAYTLDAGSYIISEDYFPGYTLTFSGDSDANGNITLAAGDVKTVTLTNNDVHVAVEPPAVAYLHVIKNVVNDYSGTSVPADFNIIVKSAYGYEVAGSSAPGLEAPGRTYALSPGTYVVSESAYPGYTLSFTGDSDSNGNVTLADGDSKTVILTNSQDAPPAVLHVIKNVVNSYGGTATSAHFSLHIKTTAGIAVVGSPAPGAPAPGTAYTLPAGSYIVSEDAYPGYAVSFSGDSDANGNITLAAGDVKTVTLTNTDIPATLYIIKNVVNDNGGTSTAGNFALSIKNALGIEVAGSPAIGVASPGRSYKLAPGTYVISEASYPGYTASLSGDVDALGNITLASGDVKTITVTNNDVLAVVVPPVTETETGGQLPDTSTNLYAMLMIGATLTLGGAMVWKTRKYVN